MFACTNPDAPRVTTGRYLHTIIATDQTPPNADIQYQEGYMDGENFVPLGVNKYHIQDRDAVYDEEEVLITPASTDMTDFSAAIDGVEDMDAAAITFLTSKI